MADTQKLVKRISDLELGDYENDKNSAYLPASVGTEKTYKYPLGAAEAAANEYTDIKIAEAIENLPPPQPTGKWLPNTTSNTYSSGVTDVAMVAVSEGAKLDIANSAELDLKGAARMKMGGQSKIDTKDFSKLDMDDYSKIETKDYAILKMLQNANMEFRTSIGTDSDSEYEDLEALGGHYGTYAIHLSNDRLGGYIIAVTGCNLNYMIILRENIEDNWGSPFGWIQANAYSFQTLTLTRNGVPLDTYYPLSPEPLTIDIEVPDPNAGIITSDEIINIGIGTGNVAFDYAVPSTSTVNGQTCWAVPWSIIAGKALVTIGTSPNGTPDNASIIAITGTPGNIAATMQIMPNLSLNSNLNSKALMFTGSNGTGDQIGGAVGANNGSRIAISNGKVMYQVVNALAIFS